MTKNNICIMISQTQKNKCMQIEFEETVPAFYVMTKKWHENDEANRTFNLILQTLIQSVYVRLFTSDLIFLSC